MADHQRMRIHPVDLEAGRNRPSVPLVPSGSFQSDKGDPAQRANSQQHQQRGHGGYGHSPLPPPPLPPPKRRGRGCCCCVLCCVAATAAVLAVLSAAAGAALYLVFMPQAPRYSVDRLVVSAFQVDPSTLTARAAFDVTVTAANPNARIGIHYGRGSSLSVWYGPYPLARGALPAFYQGRRNTTVLAVAMAGEVQLASAAVSGMRDAQLQGAVPLVFRADVPVRVQLGGLRLWRVTARVRCDLVVDRIMDVSSPIKIKASNCKFGFKL